MKYVYDPENPHEERTGTISRVKWLRKNEHPPNYQRPVHYVYTVVECYPLYSLLLASGLLSSPAVSNADADYWDGGGKGTDAARTSKTSIRREEQDGMKITKGRVDLMSLDLEGVELQVLKTIPWDMLDVAVSLHLGLNTPNFVYRDHFHCSSISSSMSSRQYCSTE